MVRAVSLDDEARAELAELAGAHRVRVPRIVDGKQGATIVLDGRQVINLASNDYLGLAGDARLMTAAKAALDEDGTGAGASRLVVGNHREHVRLEATVSAWMRREGVQLFNSGYAANVGVLTSILREGDVVLSDALNHASIIDGCRLSRAAIRIFEHRDLAALETELREASYARRRIVVTESLFSMDGDRADVAALVDLCRTHDAALIVDEAHAVGTIGPEGRGACAAAGVVPDILIGTFGKALGTFGAFAAASKNVVDLLWNRARTLVFSTGLPPMVAAAARAAIEIARDGEGDERRRTLARHARSLRGRMAGARGDIESAIVPVVIGDDREAMAVTSRLLERGVFVQGIRPPTVPEGTARLRIGLTAAHTDEQLAMAIEALRDAVRQVR
jgi:8-amino-7-oxononanoate synthase